MRWEDMYSTISHDDTTVHFYNTGMIDINGNVKNAAIALAKYMIENGASCDELIYLCMKVCLQKNKKYTIEWVGEENELSFTKPYFWNEFKKEFERYCELKAFI